MNEYLEIYNKSYDKFFKREEELLKNALKKGLKKTRPYNTVFNKLHKSNQEKYNILNSKLINNYPKSVNEFDDRKKNYSENEIQFVLDDEVFYAFSKENKNADNYLKFIDELANRECLKFINHHFQQNYDLYKYMYELDKLELFKIDDLNKNSDLSELKKQLARELYGEPVAYIESSIEVIQAKIERDEKLVQENKKLITDTKKTREIRELESDLKDINQTDKYILLNLCCQVMNTTDRLASTEFAKIITLTKDIYNNDILISPDPSSLTYYKRINGELNEIKKNLLKGKETIDSLIEKLKPFKMNKTISLLRNYKKDNNLNP